MASEITEIRDTIDKNLNDANKPWAPAFKYLEEVSGINRQIIFWVFVALTLVWLAFGYAGQLICNFIGSLYPAYASIHAIESNDKNDDTKWLTYWVVFSAFTFIEYFAAFIVGWFPLYWLAKCIFFIWLMIPSNLNGSLILYKNVIKPYFLQYREVVDDAISQVQSTASTLISEHSEQKDK